VAGKAYFVRDGMFRDVDAVLFTHVASEFGTSWGGNGNNGLVSVEYSFRGNAAHAAGGPWRGRSALDAVTLMDVGWNFRREHLRLQQRSHSVVTDGGDQPNVVPSTARAWYYFRETDYPRIMNLWAQGDSVARGARSWRACASTRRACSAPRGRSTSTGRSPRRCTPTSARRHAAVGRGDQALARGIQRETNAAGYAPRGLDSAVAALQGDVPEEQKRGGGSDDIGDVSWVVPTVTLRFPSNIPDLPGHHWANAVSMATPLAHKGVTAGAKAQAMTVLDLLVRPDLVAAAKAYFRDVQTRDTKYTPLLRPQDRPVTTLNAATMARYRDQMRRFYYDPARHRSYLEQLGVKYPTVRDPAAPATDR
jgi:aminobenzoyl-glutamate utilization protein B